jgi:hypothetical protein
MSSDDANEILSFFNDDSSRNAVMIKYSLKDSPIAKNINSNLDTLADDGLLRKSGDNSYARTQELIDLQVEMPVDFKDGVYGFYLSQRNRKKVTTPPTKAQKIMRDIAIGLLVTVIGGIILYFLTKLF